MRLTMIRLACASLVLMGWGGLLHAQDSGTNNGCNGPCDSPQLQQFSWDRDLSHTPDALREAKSFDKAAVKGESQKLIETLALPCELAEAERVGGNNDVKLYEVACRSGVGYFLLTQPRKKPQAISCLAAEASHAAEVAQGAKPGGFSCRLAGVTDTKGMAAAVLKGTNTACDVSDYRWMGVSSAGKEFSEVSCANGHGYVLEVPTAGVLPPVAVDCQEAIKSGIKCSLTAVTAPVTMQTFRDALKDHAVDCVPAQMRLIGRETMGKRYVVELQCPQQPKGLVAFIPLGDTPLKPFETLDCPAAAARSVQCKLTAQATPQN